MSRAIIHLGHPSLDASCDLPGSFRRAAFISLPIWSFSERGFPCRRMSPPCAVVSYTAFSPLPAFYKDKKHRRSVFCGTLRCLATPGCYPALCPLEFRLSSLNIKSDRLVHSSQYLKIFIYGSICKPVSFPI